MGKSKIVIEENTSKDEQGNTLLNRKVIATIVNHTEVIYEDTILAKDFNLIMEYCQHFNGGQ